MKKNYIIPETIVLHVSTQTILTGSTEEVEIGDETVDPSDFEVKDSKLFGGGSSIWDNEGWDE